LKDELKLYWVATHLSTCVDWSLKLVKTMESFSWTTNSVDKD